MSISLNLIFVCLQSIDIVYCSNHIRIFFLLKFLHGSCQCTDLKIRQIQEEIWCTIFCGFKWWNILNKFLFSVFLYFLTQYNVWNNIQCLYSSVFLFIFILNKSSRQYFCLAAFKKTKLFSKDWPTQCWSFGIMCVHA